MLSRQAQEKIQNYVRYNISGQALKGTFIFRRVDQVILTGSSTFSKVLLPEEEPEYLPFFNYNSALQQDVKLLERNIDINCVNFHGYTKNATMRAEPQTFRKREILFDSSTYRNYNITGLKFCFEKVKPIVPVAGDLVCIFMSDASCNMRYGKETPIADAWFIASDQYLRAWTAIMFDYHDSLRALVAKSTKPADMEKVLRDKLFRGNTLMTNTWRKTKLSYDQNNIEFTREESISCYWHLRVDNASRYWVDVLAALVLICRYGEIPTWENVPNTKDTPQHPVPQRDRWDLPQNFVSKLFELMNLDLPYVPPKPFVSDVQETQIVPVRVENIPVQVQPQVQPQVQVQPRAVELVFSINWS